MTDLQTDAISTGGSPADVSQIAVPLVLVADAHASSRTRRARQLASRGFRVCVARTPFETIVKASCHLPTVILVDPSLGDDIESTTTLLSSCPATAHIPVVRLARGQRLPVRLHRPAAM
jgi:CheY-like chemotaxis protein